MESRTNGKLALKAEAYTVNGVTFVFRKYGRVVVVTSSGTPTNAVATNAYAGQVTVANDFKPVATEIQYALCTGTISCQINLSTAGVFQYGYASQQISTSSNVRMGFSYISES